MTVRSLKLSHTLANRFPSRQPLAFTAQDDFDPNFPFLTIGSAPTIASFSWGDPSGSSGSIPAASPVSLAGGGDWVDDGYADSQVAPGQFDITGSHTYNAVQSYTVTATVVYSGPLAAKNQTLPLTLTVNVIPIPAPTVSLSFSPASPVMAAPFSLMATITNNAPIPLTLSTTYTGDLEPQGTKVSGSMTTPVTLAPSYAATGSTKTVTSPTSISSGRGSLTPIHSRALPRRSSAMPRATSTSASLVSSSPSLALWASWGASTRHQCLGFSRH